MKADSANVFLMDVDDTLRENPHVFWNELMGVIATTNAAILLLTNLMNVFVIDIGGTREKTHVTGQPTRGEALPKGCRPGDNANAFLSGFRLGTNQSN